MQIKYVTKLPKEYMKFLTQNTMNSSILTEVLHVPPLKCKLDLDFSSLK
jgi:hypothetical protein